MTKRQKITFTAVSIVLSVSAIPLARAQTGCNKIVAQDGTGNYTTITAGIAGLSTGQTLCVKSGIYREKITLSKEGITVKNVTGNTPILDGGYDRSLMIQGSGNPRGIATTPTSQHLPGVVVNPDGPDEDAREEFTISSMVTMSANGTTFDGFVLQNLAGEGVSMNGQNQTVQNNKFYWLYGAAIVSNKVGSSDANKPKNLNILNNRILFPTVANLDPRYNPTVIDPNTGKDPDITAQAIKIGNCRGPIRIAGNYAAFSYGEGFDIGKGCEGTADNPIIVENNTIHDTNHVKFYAVHPQYVHFRNNVAFDTNQTTVYSDGTPADAYRSTNEVSEGDLDPANNIYFYNNIAFNTDTAIALEDRGEAGSNMYVGFNTFVSGPQTRALSKFQETGNGIVENNIFHYLRRKVMTGANAQGQDITSGSPGNYTFRTNYWTHQPTQAWARSITDKIGDPLLVNSNFNVTITGFPTLGYANDQYLTYSNVNFTTNFTINNYKLTSQSTNAINAAAIRQAFSGFTPPLYPFEKDYSNTTRTNPDIGALELNDSPVPSSTPTPTPQGDAADDVDTNNDGKINIQDYNEIVTHFNAPYTLSHYNALITQYNP